MNGGLQDDRMVRTLVYSQPESYSKDAVVAAVEECMRRQAEGLLHSLDGIGGRLSQLELYCYKLERSIGELRSDVMDYHGEATVNFRCIEKNLRQVSPLPCEMPVDPGTRTPISLIWSSTKQPM
jgi:hypothetical protein